MNRMSFKRPTEHYDERVYPIDEQICGLIKQRKDISDNEPGYPPFESIAGWANKFGLGEDFLKSVFGTLYNEEHFKPQVEPDQFLRLIPLHRYVEKDGRIFSATYIRQYSNASIVNFNIDSIMINIQDGQPLHYFYKLSVGQQYNCRMIGGGGSMEHYSYNFIVSPPLPDDLSGIELIFREYAQGDKPTGLEMIF